MKHPHPHLTTDTPLRVLAIAADGDEQPINPDSLSDDDLFENEFAAVVIPFSILLRNDSDIPAAEDALDRLYRIPDRSGGEMGIAIQRRGHGFAAILIKTDDDDEPGIDLVTRQNFPAGF
jgi:hypothetical protein